MAFESQNVSLKLVFANSVTSQNGSDLCLNLKSKWDKKKLKIGIIIFKVQVDNIPT